MSEAQELDKNTDNLTQQENDGTSILELNELGMVSGSPDLDNDPPPR